MSNLAVHERPPSWIMQSGVAFNPSGNIAKNIDEAIKQLKNSITITLGRPLDEMRDSLNELFYRECSYANWDGYGAVAISKDAYEEADQIINLLPSAIPMPEIVAEPTGAIGFEWHKDKRQVFVISVSGKHRITYAGIFSGNKVHGSEYFEDTLPLAIIQHLRRLYL